MAGAGTGGSDVGYSSDGGGLYTLIVPWTSVTSHSMFESGGDRLTADRFIPVLTNVAMSCCLLGIDPSRRNPGSFRLSSAVLCVSCSSTTATRLKSASCRMTSFEFGVGETLGIELKY